MANSSMGPGASSSSRYNLAATSSIYTHTVPGAEACAPEACGEGKAAVAPAAAPVADAAAASVAVAGSDDAMQASE
jgi:hypothetical protein